MAIRNDFIWLISKACKYDVTRIQYNIGYSVTLNMVKMIQTIYKTTIKILTN